MDVDGAYRICEQITGEQARNFSWGIRLLPAPKRRALSAVYALARRIDDIGDGELPSDEKLRQLAQVRKQSQDPGRYPDDPVLVAVHDAAQRFPIPLGAFAELVDGCEMDVSGQTYGDLDELLHYCHNVAGTIGLLSLGVFNPPLAGAEKERAESLANSLGLGLQLTNILRDIREDLSNGRVYLPKKDLELFDVQLALLPDGSLDPQDGRLAELIRFEAVRAASRYDEGLQLLTLLDWRSAACCGAMAGIYRELLSRIAADPSIVFRQRAALSTRDKLRVAARSLVQRGARHGR